jgi:RNA polymerase sigma-70 factor, ECF subfamily
MMAMAYGSDRTLALNVLVSGVTSGKGIDAEGTTDEALVARIAKGDKRALQILYCRHNVFIYRFVLRFLSNEASAEDVVSDVFLAVWRRAGRFEGRSQVSTWLLAIARNKALSFVCARTTEPLNEEIAETVEDLSDDPEASLQKEQRHAILQDCLTQLSAVHREIVDLVYYHGKKIEEAATILGVPLNTVKTRMFYARKRIGELIAAKGLAPALI